MILLYDNECQLCNRFKKALEVLDVKNQIKFVSVYDQAIYLQNPELKQEECEEVIHLIIDEKIYKGSEVITELVKLFPGVKKFSWLLDNNAAQTALDSFYNRINDMRGMQKRNCYTCGSNSKVRRRR